jgi:hypothetical protein
VAFSLAYYHYLYGTCAASSVKQSEVQNWKKKETAREARLDLNGQI